MKGLCRGLLLCLLAAGARPAAAAEVELERLTWVEVRDLVKAGTTTVIVPSGGTEQNGPHMVLGKHNFIVRETARRIAAALGDALVAPVIAYVPEGDVNRRDGHMAFARTLSLPEPVFAQLLEAAARSFRLHGFKSIVLLGDSGGNQAAQAEVARRLTREWQREGVQVIHAERYYAGNGQREWLAAQGESDAAIGRHAGMPDTSELLAVYPDGVRFDRAQPDGGAGTAETGVLGDPSRANAAYGDVLLRLKVEAAVAEIRAKRGAP